MMDNVEAKVKELVTDFKLEEALDVLIAQAQTQTQRKQNVLLVLKGKLALLEEQSLSGMLTADEVARQKATIAHQILDIADGSPLDFELPNPKQTTASSTGGGGGWVKYLLVAGLVVVAVAVGIFVLKSGKDSHTSQADEPTTEQPNKAQTNEAPTNQTTAQPGGPLQVLNFPSLQLPFNFLDNGIEFRWAEAEWISDTEIRLKIRYYLTCKSNLGVCYRPNLRLYADSRPIAPAEQSNLEGWVAKDATITDDIKFVLPADTKTFEIELSRDHSTWRRPFNILK
jgi:hypothetical protein